MGASCDPSFQMYTMGTMLEMLYPVKYRWGKEKLIAGGRARESMVQELQTWMEAKDRKDAGSSPVAHTLPCSFLRTALSVSLTRTCVLSPSYPANPHFSPLTALFPYMECRLVSLSISWEDFIYLFIYPYVMNICLHACLCTACMQCPLRPEQKVRSL